MEKRKNYKKAAQEFLKMLSVAKSEDKEVVYVKLLRSIGNYKWDTFHHNQVIGKFFIEQLNLGTLAEVLFDYGNAMQDGKTPEANRILMSFLRQLKQESAKNS